MMTHKGPYLVMRYAPRIGYPASAQKIVTVAARTHTLTGAIGDITARGRRLSGGYWIAKAGQPAHRTMKT
jgi:hypothetical protein